MKKSKLLAVFLFLLSYVCSFGQIETLFNETFNVDPFIVTGAATTTLTNACLNSTHGYSMDDSMTGACGISGFTFPNGNGQFMTCNGHPSPNGTVVTDAVYDRLVTPTTTTICDDTVQVTFNAMHRLFGTTTNGLIVNLSVNLFDANGTIFSSQAFNFGPGQGNIWQTFNTGPVLTSNGLSRVQIFWTCDNYSEDFAIDDIMATYSPESTIADAVLVDANGTPKEAFCIGEEIFLDASNSVNYNEHYIALSDETNDYFAFLIPEWAPGTIASPFNVTEAIQSMAWMTWPPGTPQPAEWSTCPGMEFNLRFAIRYIECGEYWESVNLPFTMECCDEFPLDPYFELEAFNSNGTFYNLAAVNFEPYLTSNFGEHCDVEHQWCIYSSESANGPYNLEMSYSGPSLSYTAQDGTWFTVVHNVSSPCGEWCYGANICRNCDDDEMDNCKLCGPLDDCPKGCSFIEPVCNTPENLDCSLGHGYVTLTWDAVIGADGYYLEIIPNANECCESIPGPAPQIHYVNDTNYSILLSQSSFSCFAWRVRADCGKGGTSEYSPYYCYSEEKCTIMGESFIGNGTGLQFSNSPQPLVYPNPSDGNFTIQLDTHDELEITIKVFDTNGKVITVFEKESIPSGHYFRNLDLKNILQPGIYYLNIKTNHGNFNEKVILMK